MEHENMKEVRFDIYCEKCEHVYTKDTKEPCDSCLSISARQYSSKPEYFKEKQ